jgi:hypothetical protein
MAVYPSLLVNTFINVTALIVLLAIGLIFVFIGKYNPTKEDRNVYLVNTGLYLAFLWVWWGVTGFNTDWFFWGLCVVLTPLNLFTGFRTYRSWVVMEDEHEKIGG